MFSVGELSLASFIGFGLGFAVAMSIFAVMYEYKLVMWI